MKKKTGTTTTSVSLPMEMRLFIDTYDISLSDMVQSVVSYLMQMNDGDPENLSKAFHAAQERETEIFKASLETYQNSMAVKTRKQRRGKEEIENTLFVVQRALRTPPWNETQFREVVKRYSLELREAGLDVDDVELEAFKRGYLRVDEVRQVPFVPEPLSPKPHPPVRELADGTVVVDATQVGKKAEESLEKLNRNLTHLLSSKPRKEHPELRVTILNKQDWRALADEAGVNLGEYFDNLQQQLVDGVRS